MGFRAHWGSILGFPHPARPKRWIHASDAYLHWGSVASSTKSWKKSVSHDRNHENFDVRASLPYWEKSNDLLGLTVCQMTESLKTLQRTEKLARSEATRVFKKFSLVEAPCCVYRPRFCVRCQKGSAQPKWKSNSFNLSCTRVNATTT